MYWTVDWTGKPLGQVIFEETQGDTTLRVYEHIDYGDGKDRDYCFDAYLGFSGFPERLVGYSVRRVSDADTNNLDNLRRLVVGDALVLRSRFIATALDVKAEAGALPPRQS